MFWPSVVVQALAGESLTLGKLETKISGSLARDEVSLPEPPETVTGAQFVELAVTHLVEPGPGEGVLAIGNVGRHHDIEAAGDGPGGRRSHWSIARRVHGAATNDLVNDLELRVLGGLSVGRDGELARATTVNGGALEGDGLLGASRPVVHLGHGKAVGLLAWVISRRERVLSERSLVVGDGVSHPDVGAGAGSERQEESSGGRHCDMGWVGLAKWLKLGNKSKWLKDQRVKSLIECDETGSVRNVISAAGEIVKECG